MHSSQRSANEAFKPATVRDHKKHALSPQLYKANQLFNGSCATDSLVRSLTCYPVTRINNRNEQAFRSGCSPMNRYRLLLNYINIPICLHVDTPSTRLYLIDHEYICFLLMSFLIWNIRKLIFFMFHIGSTKIKSEC